VNRPKFWVSMVGLGLALVGVATENRYVIWAAIAVLGLAVLTSLVSRRRARTSEADEAESGE
jgi:membrane protein implicated in regulation of membrane protease activity